MREKVLIQMDGELFHRLILIWLFYDVSFYIYLKGTVTRVLILLYLEDYISIVETGKFM
jgi:hypothetical protein